MFGNKQVAIVNVEANTRFSLRSPIFRDRRFELMPIPTGRLAGKNGYERWIDKIESWPTYEDLRSYYDKREHLKKYLPSNNRVKWLKQRMHNDPQLDPTSGCLNYGDYYYPKGKEKYTRAANLWKLGSDDFILFLAHLWDWVDSDFEGDGRFYLIGLIEIKEYMNLDRPDERRLKCCKENPHVLEWLNRKVDPPAASLMDFANHRVFMGTENSHRFEKAVPFDWKIAVRVLRDSKGRKLARNGGTELSRIGSYTRAVRLIEGEDADERKKILWKHIRKNSGKLA